MAYPDILQADDYEGIRHLLGVTELDLENDSVDQLPFGPQAEAYVQSRLEDWVTLMTDPVKALLIRMTTAYIAAAYIAETYVQGGVVGLVRIPGQPGTRDWAALAKQLWARASQTLAEVSTPTADEEFDLKGQAINGPSRAYYRPLVGREWWKFPPVYGTTGLPLNPPEY
jgi:hypothetical protein